MMAGNQVDVLASLTSDPWTCWPLRWHCGLFVDGWVRTKAQIWLAWECLCVKPLNNLSSCVFSFSRLNRNKLQVLPELLFQSNPKLGRLWVHLSYISILPSRAHTLPATFHLFWCVTWSIRMDGGRGAVSELLSGLRVANPLAMVTQCCSVLPWRGEKECASASARPIFKRWKGAWSECFAWTCEEFLFRNTNFPEWKRRSYWWREDSHMLFSLSPCTLFFPPKFSICLVLRESLPAQVKGWNTYIL